MSAYGKGAHKAICHTAKQNFVEPFGYEKTTIIPQCLLTEITIRLDAHIKRVMPSHVERQGFNRSCVTQVMQLLQEQHANDDVQIFRRAPQAIIKMRQQFLDRKIIEKMVSKDPRLRTIQQQAPLLAHR